MFSRSSHHSVYLHHLSVCMCTLTCARVDMHVDTGERLWVSSAALSTPFVETGCLTGLELAKWARLDVPRALGTHLPPPPSAEIAKCAPPMPDFLFMRVFRIKFRTLYLQALYQPSQPPPWLPL